MIHWFNDLPFSTLINTACFDVDAGSWWFSIRFCCCSVDFSTALIFSVVDRENSNTVLVKLFGNPVDYVTALSSNSSQHRLPIRINSFRWPDVKRAHGLAVDSWTSLVYLVDTRLGRIESGSFIFGNTSMTEEGLFNAPPPIKQVSPRYKWKNKIWRTANEVN